VKVIGHKGGGAAALENSRAGLQHALDLDLDAVEVDVWPTADREFVLFHDADVIRMTGQLGQTMHLTSAQLRALEVGGLAPASGSDRLLLLQEALELLAGRVELFLEVKRTRHELDRYTWLEARLTQVLREAGALPWTTVVSFDHRSLLHLRERYPDLKTGMLYHGEWLNLWQEIGVLKPESLLPHWAQTTPVLVSEAHANNLSVYPWVVNNDEWLEAFMGMGVDGIITDRPEALLALCPQRSRTAGTGRSKE
jgi:glycerophosphoryl diester phosphodiesterase